MSDLTQSQKAAAFDTGMKYLYDGIKQMKAAATAYENGTPPKSDYYDNVEERRMMLIQVYAEIIVQFDPQLSAQPEQAENMPPAGLDLSKHVGRYARLWNGDERLIELRGKRWGVDEYYPIALTANLYDPIFVSNDGHYILGTPTQENVKTILP